MVPVRVVSLVPSLTELVFWFGRGDCLAGRTRFCIEPAGEVETVPIVGGTKNPRVDRIIALAPDLVLSNREENRKEDVEALQAAGLRVLLTDPNTVEGALEMVLTLGRTFEAEHKAERLVAATRAAMSEAPPSRLPVFAVVWKSPLMGLGGNSYGSSLLEAAGAVNVLAHQPRYPELTLDDLPALRPSLILLPDEPYPFTEADIPSFASFAPTRLIDGKLLWWYGPRMPAAIRALRELFAEVQSS